MANFSKIAPALLVAASAAGFSQSAQAEARYLLLPFLLPRPAAVSPLAPPAAVPGATPGSKPGTPPGGQPAGPPPVTPPPVTPPPPPPGPPVTPPPTPPTAVPPTIGAPISVILNGQNVCRPGAAPSHQNKPSKSNKTDGKASYDGGPDHGGGALCGVGEPNAIGSATILLARFPSAIQFCYALTVTGLNNPTEAHVHRGRAGQTGPSLISLIPPKSPRDGDPGASSGCVNISLTLAQAIHASPMDYYIDVVTKKFPDGAIRGQLR